MPRYKLREITLYQTRLYIFIISVGNTRSSVVRKGNVALSRLAFRQLLGKFSVGFPPLIKLSRVTLFVHFVSQIFYLTFVPHFGIAFA